MRICCFQRFGFKVRFALIIPLLLSSSVFADYINVWNYGVSGEGGNNEVIIARNTFNNLVGWNSYCETVELKYQIHYYVNYNWTDDENRVIQVTAKLYEDDGIMGDDWVTPTHTKTIYGNGLGNYTSGLHYYIGPNGWIAKLNDRDGTIVGRSPSNATFSSIGYFTWTWSALVSILHWRVDAEFYAHVFIDDGDAGSETYDGDWHLSKQVPWEDPTFTITSPRSGYSWSAGSPKTINWNSTWYDYTVEFKYSTNGGSSWSTITSSTQNDGAYNWSIPSGISSNNCKVLIINREIGLNRFYHDESDTFTITSPPPTISGYVRTSGATGIGGVTINFSGVGSTTTSSSGYYSKDVSYGWSGTVTPVKSGYSFSPPSTPYSNVTSNKSNENYTGTPIKPTVSIIATDSSAAEPANNGYFTVSRTGSTSGSLRIYYGTSGSAGTSGSDYAALPGYVDIPSGQSSTLIPVVVIDDSTTENSETVHLTISSNSAYAIGSPSSATVTIADDDTKPTVSIVAVDSDAGELPPGDPSYPDDGVFRVTRTGSTTSQLVVYYNVSGSATLHTDYVRSPEPIGGTFVAIPQGATFADISVRPVDDLIVEGAEIIIFTLESDAVYTVGSPSSATVTISDDDWVVTNLYVYSHTFDHTFSEWQGYIAIDFTDSKIYVRQEQEVKIFATSGSFIESFTFYGWGGGIAVDTADAVYVPTYDTQSKTATVKVYGRWPTGGWSLMRYWDLHLPYVPTTGYNQSMAVAADNSNIIYVLCSDEVAGSVVQKFDRYGNLLDDWQPDEMLTPPVDMSLEYTNDIVYLLSYNWARVYRYQNNGTLFGWWGNSSGGSSEDGKFDHPRGIATSMYGITCVADTGNDRVQVFDGAGNFMAKIGTTGIGPGQFQSPEAIAMSAVGDWFYVLDTQNHNLQAFVKNEPQIGDFCGANSDQPDGYVDYWDLLYFAQRWHSNPSDNNWDPRCDLDKEDNYVDYWDLLVFAKNWHIGQKPE